MAGVSARFPAATKRLIKLALSLCAAIGCLVIAITFLPVVPWTASVLAGDFAHPSGDVLVVLAHSVEVLPVGIVLDRGSYWLSEYAQTAYRQGNFRRIILTGGGNPGTPVAAIMADLLQSNDVPPDVIEVEVSSRNMREQAEGVRSMLGEHRGPVVLLASDYQMFRAVRVFEKLGMTVKPLPLGDAAFRSEVLHDRWTVFLDLAREAGHIAKYWQRGWM